MPARELRDLEYKSDGYNKGAVTTYPWDCTNRGCISKCSRVSAGGESSALGKLSTINPTDLLLALH
jgi:hypothetical protein